MSDERAVEPIEDVARRVIDSDRSRGSGRPGKRSTSHNRGRKALISSMVVAAVMAGGLFFLLRDRGSSSTDLTGHWIATGYTCPSGVAVPREEVDVVQRGNQLTATKTVGDDCIKVGEVTFEATITGNQGTATFHTANPGGSPSQSGAQLSLIDSNHFRLEAPLGSIDYQRAGAR